MTPARFLTAAVASMASVWLIFCLWFYWGDNHRKVLRPISVPAVSWSILSGEGEAESGRLRLTGAGSRGGILMQAPLPTPLSGQAVDRVEVQLDEPRSFHGFSVGLSRSQSVSAGRRVAARWVDGRTAVVRGHNLFMDNPTLAYVTIQVRTGLNEPFSITSTEVHRARPDFAGLQSLLVDSLVDFGGWTQRSINHNRPEYAPLKVSAVPAIVVWAILTCILLLGPRILSRRIGRNQVVATVVVVLLLGTFLLDAGWQVTLWERHGQAVGRYSVVDPHDRRRNNVDGELYGFIEEVKSRLDSDSNRVVVFADSLFGFLRARYFAVPNPVTGRKGAHPRWLYRMRSGDVLIAIGNNQNLHRESVAETRREAPSGRSRPWPVESTERNGEWVAQSNWIEGEGSNFGKLTLTLTAQAGQGWVSVLIEGRGGNNPGRVRRDVYLTAGKQTGVTLPFKSEAGGEYRFRVRATDALSVKAVESELSLLSDNSGVERLSVARNSPYVLARRIALDSEKIAWEIL
ncbi:hypothetical protein [Wenzhouxiangella sp. EGI_FJ10305]|uniref:hypothetical protein n=1 Tax=Wenzhouxiangella sp. EGI_FJ10305 TaxID=3243768 RepID=UPI0035DDF9A1